MQPWKRPCTRDGRCGVWRVAHDALALFDNQCTAVGWIVDFTTLAARVTTTATVHGNLRGKHGKRSIGTSFRYIEHQQKYTMPSMSTYIKAISGYDHHIDTA
jgi:hypothetical protein